MNRQQQIERFLAQAHVLAVERLRAQPLRVREVQAQLVRWRGQLGPTRSDVYLDEWERLLGQPIEKLEEAVCVDADHATVLRSVSPVSVLITQAERTQLLAQARLGA